MLYLSGKKKLTENFQTIVKKTTIKSHQATNLFSLVAIVLFVSSESFLSGAGKTL